MEGTPWARKDIFGNTYLGGVEQRAAHDPGSINGRKRISILPFATERGADANLHGRRCDGSSDGGKRGLVDSPAGNEQNENGDNHAVAAVTPV